MSIVRFIVLSTALILPACASTTDAGPSSSNASNLTDLNELGPQSLALRECGLFGWTAGETPRFILFATEGRGQYWDGSRPVALDPDGVFPNLSFSEFTLELGEREAFDDAVRYPSAKMRMTLDDGFERVQPIVILETCQTSEVSS